MNFYQAQDDARRRTKWLVLYFILAVTGVVMALYTVVGFVMVSNGQTYSYNSSGNLVTKSASWWDTGMFFTVAGLTTGVILLGSVYKAIQLSDGGEVVARDVGGRPVDPHTTDVAEKRLVNVVEEMAIASGVPSPQVWIMDHESGINAFAAGTEPGNAVIGVTRGCVQRLSRSELQGVIAHEFSHILNGDMKLNMRLIGWLFGILMLSLLGRTLLYSLRHVRFSSSRDSKNSAGAIILIMLVAGIALLVIGSIGVFFGRMIQAAISRQREYLADASAVQFTRDTSGIAGALKKIGGQEYGSEVKNAKAGEASHMFFADGGMFSYGFATHPPLDVRIKTLEAEWDGKFEDSELPPVADHTYNEQGSQFSEMASGFAGSSAAPSASGVSQASNETQVRVDQADWNKVGDAAQTSLAIGQQIRQSLPENWVEACHDREYAQALVFGLLVAGDEQLRQGEIKFLEKRAGQRAVELVLQWHDTLKEAHSSQKIALIDLSIPTLRRLSLPEYDRFIEITRWMIASDGQVDIFEYMLQKVSERHLDSYFYPSRSPRVKYNKLRHVKDEVNILLSTMAGIGADSGQSLAESYTSATQDLGYELGESIAILPADQCTLKHVETALERVEQCSSVVKRQIIHACGLAVMHDGVLDSREAEMLRAVADAIGCAIPPFVK